MRFFIRNWATNNPSVTRARRGTLEVKRFAVPKLGSVNYIPSTVTKLTAGCKAFLNTVFHSRCFNKNCAISTFLFLCFSYVNIPARCFFIPKFFICFFWIKWAVSSRLNSFLSIFNVYGNISCCHWTLVSAFSRVGFCFIFAISVKHSATFGG